MFSNLFGLGSTPFFSGMFNTNTNKLPLGDFIGPRLPGQQYDTAIGPMPGTGAPMPANTIPGQPDNAQQMAGLLAGAMQPQAQPPMPMMSGSGGMQRGTPEELLLAPSMAIGQMPRFNLRGGLLS
jgi:hypothetical protein